MFSAYYQKGMKQLSSSIKVSNVRVDVTQDVLTNAVLGNSNRCAVAVALQRRFPSATHVTVDIHTMRLSIPENGKRYIFLTPGRVQQYIFDFDEGKSIKPFSFHLRKAAWIADASSHGGSDRPERGIARTEVVRKNNGKVQKTSIKVEDTHLPPPENSRTTGRRVKGLRAVRGWDVNPDFKP